MVIVRKPPHHLVTKTHGKPFSIPSIILK
uniref:Uncharacterized protein n=1 Tax=Rhizophora mucronata TaxID=61149 RepID=A0A2P2PG87_RHIMU